MKHFSAQSTLWIQTFVAVSLATFISACGTSDFGGSSGKSTDGTVKPRPPAVTPPTSPTVTLTGLNWYWQCVSDPGTLPGASESNAVVQGGGDHTFSKTNFATNVPVTMSGRICPPSKYPRDIVLVLDASGSMKQNDDVIKKTGTCGRKDAVDAIIKDALANGNDARFAVVTFSDAVNAQSSAMFADEKNLYADIAGAKSLSDVLCQIDGGTNYGPALSGAEKILSSSRPGAMKEIYFISDGEPNDGGAGKVIAQRLKSSGVTIGGTLMPVQIATVMLGSQNGRVLQEDIASVGVDSKPLFAVASDASVLAATLSKLAANDIDSGSIKYRPIGSTAWTEVSLKGLIKDNNFVIPAFNTSVQTAPLGVEATYEYRDLHSNVYTSGGAIKWQVAP